LQFSPYMIDRACPGLADPFAHKHMILSAV
jgi:hypothetical protein